MRRENTRPPEAREKIGAPPDLGSGAAPRGAVSLSEHPGYRLHFPGL